MYLFCNMDNDMRIFTEQALKKFVEKHPASRTALQVWSKAVKKSEWKNFADMRKTFNSVDAIGGQRYVFNVKGNEYRIVAIIKFTIGFLYVRFVGTHSEYDKIDSKTI